MALTIFLFHNFKVNILGSSLHLQFQEALSGWTKMFYDYWFFWFQPMNEMQMSPLLNSKIFWPAHFSLPSMFAINSTWNKHRSWAFSNKGQWHYKVGNNWGELYSYSSSLFGKSVQATTPVRSMWQTSITFLNWEDKFEKLGSRKARAVRIISEDLQTSDLYREKILRPLQVEGWKLFSWRLFLQVEKFYKVP